ncbi:STAS domain-containing protein [Spirillospora sp. NPDC047279]|uniref:STAS domain-containing protein n=1 Tax=Spirillospora sp. NPDC047279 TaxID=3155478 RepID=UPI0033EE072E
MTATLTVTTEPTVTSGPQAPPEVSMPAPRRPGRTIVALYGDLDLAAAPALRELLRGALTHSARLLILDLSEVRSCDTTGLAVLVGTQRSAAGANVMVSLAAPGPQVARMLRVTRLDRLLTVHPTVQDAITSSCRRPADTTA